MAEQDRAKEERGGRHSAYDSKRVSRSPEFAAKGEAARNMQSKRGISEDIRIEVKHEQIHGSVVGVDVISGSWMMSNGCIASDPRCRGRVIRK